MTTQKRAQTQAAFQIHESSRNQQIQIGTAQSLLRNIGAESLRFDFHNRQADAIYRDAFAQVEFTTWQAR